MGTGKMKRTMSLTSLGRALCPRHGSWGDDPGRTAMKDDMGSLTRSSAMDLSQNKLMVLFKGGRENVALYVYPFYFIIIILFFGGKLIH